MVDVRTWSADAMWAPSKYQFNTAIDVLGVAVPLIVVIDLPAAVKRHRRPLRRARLWLYAKRRTYTRAT